MSQDDTGYGEILPVLSHARRIRITQSCFALGSASGNATRLWRIAAGTVLEVLGDEDKDYLRVVHSGRTVYIERRSAGPVGAPDVGEEDQPEVQTHQEDAVAVALLGLFPFIGIAAWWRWLRLETQQKLAVLVFWLMSLYAVTLGFFRFVLPVVTYRNHPGGGIEPVPLYPGVYTRWPGFITYDKSINVLGCEISDTSYLEMFGLDVVVLASLVVVVLLTALVVRLAKAALGTFNRFR